MSRRAIGPIPERFRRQRKSIDEIDLNRAIYFACSRTERFFTVDIMKFGAVRFVPCISLLLVSTVALMAAETAHLSIDASKAGAKIDRNLFGQFAENLGHGLYEGIWVGTDSPIPNTRGIRNDVVIALRALKAPNVRWPGGCFGDEYHWRKGVGPTGQRPATLNSAWGGVVDANSFGTHEFMDFLQQIGSQAYVSINVGSGTPQEAGEWLEYMTAARPTALAKERAANGHPDPYSVGFLGIGNETWGCGGNMTADYYLSQLKIYSHFVRNDNPSQQGPNQMLKIAVGPGTPETEWTETIMRAWQHHDWSWNIEGLSLHWYTVPNGWPPRRLRPASALRITGNR
jgi:alpha-L-arabinofuranosidase